MLYRLVVFRVAMPVCGAKGVLRDIPHDSTGHRLLIHAEATLPLYLTLSLTHSHSLSLSLSLSQSVPLSLSLSQLPALERSLAASVGRSVAQ